MTESDLMIVKLKSRLAKVARQCHQLAEMLSEPESVPELHQSRLAVRLAGIDAELADLVASTETLVRAQEQKP